MQRSQGILATAFEHRKDQVSLELSLNEDQTELLNFETTLVEMIIGLMLIQMVLELEKYLQVLHFSQYFSFSFLLVMQVKKVQLLGNLF